jgi:hypothetical protein
MPTSSIVVSHKLATREYVSKITLTQWESDQERESWWERGGKEVQRRSVTCPEELPFTVVCCCGVDSLLPPSCGVCVRWGSGEVLSLRGRGRRGRENNTQRQSSGNKNFESSKIQFYNGYIFRT